MVTQQILSSQLSFTLGLYPTDSTFSAIIYSTLGLYPTDSTFSAIIYSGSLPIRFYLLSYHLLWVFTQQILPSQLSFTLGLYSTDSTIWVFT